jgi:hypothetical protein
MPLPLALLPSLGAIGSAGAGTLAAGVGAGGLAMGAGTAGAAGAIGAGAASGASGIASGLGGSALGAAPALGAKGLAGASSAPGLMGGGMNFSGVASKMAVPGAPGHVGGTPMVAPSGAGMGQGIMGNPYLDKLKAMSEQMGSGGQGMPLQQERVQPPSLIPGNFGPFQPFAFDRANYQSRRPLGY